MTLFRLNSLSFAGISSFLHFSILISIMCCLCLTSFAKPVHDFFEESNGLCDNQPTSGSQPLPLLCAIAGTDVMCNMPNSGSANANITGGMVPYAFTWSNGETTEDIGNLTFGLYSLTVTDGANSTSSCSVSIGGFQCAINKTNCGVNNQGAATAAVSGGSEPYTYSWSTGETTAHIDDHIPATYNLQVTDANGCETTCEVTIEPCIICDTTCYTSYGRINNFQHCFDEFGFNEWGWSNGLLSQGSYTADLYADAIDCDINAAVIVGEVLVTYLNDSVTIVYNTFGNYLLRRTDAYVGCFEVPTNNGLETVAPGIYANQHALNYKTTDTFMIDVSSFPCEGIYISMHAGTCEPNVLICDISAANVDCQVSYTGSANAMISGGKLPYGYVWSTGETTANILGLVAGTYGLMVTDANECEKSCEVVIDRCNRCDTTCVTAFGFLDGVQSCFDEFGYTEWGWSNGILPSGAYTFDLYAEALLCDINIGELIGEVDLVFQNDTVWATYNLFGDYFMELTSLFVGCEDIPTINGMQTIAPSQYPYIETHDGVTSYTYVIDVHQLPCEGIFVIAHAEACKRNPLVCEVQAINTNCEGIADATAVGGTSPYTYLWSNGATAEDLANLQVGNYSLSVTDASSCITTCTVSITYQSIQAPPIGPFCQNDAPFDLSDIFMDPSFNGSWTGPGVNGNIFYPSSLSTGNHVITYEDISSCTTSMLTVVINPRCCPEDYLEINGRKLIGVQASMVHYETDGLLESNQTILTTTVYDSGSGICLQAGFEVNIGAVFTAILDGCP